MPARRYVLDRSVQRFDGGRVLLGGSPLRLFTLTDGGAKLIDRVEAGRPVAPNPLVDRLLDTGVFHPAPYTQRIVDDSSALPLANEFPGQGLDDAQRIVDDSLRLAMPNEISGRAVTVVVPAWNASVERLVAHLGPVGGVIVVDDASPQPVTAPHGVRVVRRAVNGGPAAARNAGLALVDTPLVAFVDSDVTPTDGWLTPLLDHFLDERVALVAPRVRSTADDRAGVLARYEAIRSPLDLGPEPGAVRARTRVSYVPSAAWVARTDAVRAAGGFDEAMRVGEDVDLVWRLAEAGWRVRYEPASVVHHRPRATLRAWLTQRAGYGRSAAALAQRHKGALAPAGVSAWSAGAWTLAAAGPIGALAGGAVAAGSALALVKKLSSLAQPRPIALRLAGRGHLHAGRQLASAITRAWWPLALVAAVASRRARRTALAAALLPALNDWSRQRPPVDPLRYLALRLADDVAYGWGVWHGVIQARTIDPLIPDLSSWPSRSRYDEALVANATAASTTPTITTA